ncbi:hypothetical protein N7519_009815 [Penicillium mononematosum]|uniref:uncharacterized protein n=1 Tax=Penicillium mononematosum TaxID=268346 RepID=UPI002547F576|nr:uncharacterized protein N7519_009815 [Penicillium mononematosum]KAJ6179354.1 hypothetical protein N7519_009815 [Penicillium mononematosum]
MELAIDELEEKNEHKIDVAQLKQYGIVHQRMTLDRGDTARKPFFFAPHPSILEPSEETDDELRSTLAFEDTCFNEPVDRSRQVAGPWSYYIPHDRDDPVYDYRPYKDLYKHDDPEFGAFGMTDILGKDFPHTKTTMYNGLDATDEIILRGELLTILRVMLGQLRKVRLHHKKAPVFLVSFAGKRARAFEAYSNGETLFLRTTKLYNFPEETSVAYKDLAEWIASSPTGDTS